MSATPIGKIVLDGVTKFFKEKPEQKYTVIRQSITGPVQEQVSLAQMIATQTDQMMIANSLIQQHNQLMHQMLLELQENRKIGEELQKQGERKRRRRDRDDEDEE